jgi:ABC-type oligopeptide transport system substrate-binding subunit
MKRWSFVLILCLGVLLSGGVAFAQKDGGTLRYPVNAEPRPLDPQHWYSEKVSNIICQHIYENLIGIDKEFKIVPELATSWKMSPDQKSCTFTLRKVDPEHLGAFLQLMEFQTAFMGELLDINAFDQEGVELGKKFTYGLMGRTGF